MTHYNLDHKHSVLASLRAGVPSRSLHFTEALRIAELQATRLLELTGVDGAPVPHEVISELPRIRVESRELPTSGASFWDGQTWVICLNRREPLTRQRFTLFHEYKHIVDHGRTGQLYRGSKTHTPEQQAEQAADYFAGCVLMSRTELKRAWARGLQNPTALARHFDVSERAISVRLAQTGLSEDVGRCRPILTRPWPPRGRYYYRQLSATWLLQEQVA